MNPDRRALLGCLVLTDSEGRINFCSESFAARVGEPAETLLGRRAASLFSEDALNGKPFFFRGKECELQQFDVAGANGEVYLHIFVLRDEGTALPVKDMEILSTPGAAEIPRLTHDLNNIFTVIYASMDMLSRGEISPNETREAIESAQRAASRGAEMVTRIRQAIGRDPVAMPATAVPRNKSKNNTAAHRILVLSSEKTMRLLLRAVLAYRGFEVIDAIDAIAAGACLDASRIDLLLVDVPAASGDWKSCVRRVTSLLLVGEGERVDGAVPTMRKPFDNLDLVGRIRTLLEANKPA